MRKKPRRAVEVFILAAVFFLALGCTENPVIGSTALDFASEVSLIENMRRESGLNDETIARIDSAELFSAEEAAQLGQAISQYRQKLNNYLGGGGSFVEGKEKDALLDYVRLELARADYFKLMVALKDSGEFTKLADAFGAFDFSGVPASTECASLGGAAGLKEEFTEASFMEISVNDKIRLFNELHSEFAQAAMASEKKPKLEGSGLREFIDSAGLLFDSCTALAGSLEALVKLEEFAEQENLCFGLKELEGEIESLAENAEKIDSMSKKAANIKVLSIDSAGLQEKAKALLSLSAELAEIYSQLLEECG